MKILQKKQTKQKELQDRIEDSEERESQGRDAINESRIEVVGVPSPRPIPQLVVSDVSADTPRTISSHEITSFPDSCLVPYAAGTEQASGGDKTGARKVSFSDSSKTPSGHRKTVSFDKVEIHFHELILGDHPDCVDGPPIGIGNAFGEKHVSVDHFEHTRRGKRRKGEKSLFISSLQRLKLLKGTGKYKSSEIYDRMDEVQNIRKERQNSCRGLVWKTRMRNLFQPTKVK